MRTVSTARAVAIRLAAAFVATLPAALPLATCADDAHPTHPAFDRLSATWNRLHAYGVTIDSHEVLGDTAQDREIHYFFRKPDHAQLDVLNGPSAGATVVWDGGDRVQAYKRGLSFFKLHADAHDKRVTSLRGNSVLTPDLGRVLDCYGGHRDALRESAGPVVAGEATDEISLTYAGLSCPDDSAADKGITLDVLDVSRSSGLVVERRRYEGDAVVERWELHDYSLDSDAAAGSS
jgi:hypothetical protein